jgi:hypothetical protein
VIGFLASQIGVEYSAIVDYDWSGSSWKRHRAQMGLTDPRKAR